MKKIIISLLSFALLLVNIQSVQSLTQTGQINITNNIEDTGITIDGENVSAYQVLQREGYSYKVNAKYIELFENLALENNVTLTGDTELAEYAISFINESNSNDLMNILYQFTIDNNIKTSNTSVFTKSDNLETATIDSLNLGYYIVLYGTTDFTPLASAFVSELNTTVDIYMKASKPTVDKEVYNDDIGDYDSFNSAGINDFVYFKLSTVVPNVSNYDEYIFKMYDQMTTGLSFQNDVTVMINDSNLPAIQLNNYYTVTKIDDQNFIIEFDILNAIDNNILKTGDEISVYYSALLNENAIIGEQGNQNTVNLEYSNNPFMDTVSKTPDVTTTTYTFDLNILKTDATNTPLVGVEFNLYIDEIVGAFTKTTDLDGTNIYTISTESSSNTTTTLITGSNGKIKVLGICEHHNYKLVEIKPLDGYLNLDDVVFDLDVQYDSNGNITFVGSNIDGIDQDGTNYALDLTIINYKEIDLPNTGGAGTWLFLTVGSGFIIISMLFISFIILKQKKSNKHEKTLS